MEHLKSLDLVLQLVESETNLEGADSIVAGLMPSVSGLRQLQELQLTTDGLGPATTASLGSLTQLTSLRLIQCKGPPQGLDLSPLSGLTRLVELEVVISPGTTTAPASAAGPFCLPSSLQRLKLWRRSESCLEHLPGCPQLLVLHLEDPSTHPADVLKLAARATPRLQQLTITAQQTYRRRPLPCAALQSLTDLQHVDLRDGSICVEHAADWWALAHLKGLTTLNGITVCGL
jgi:hypothetical protein